MTEYFYRYDDISYAPSLDEYDNPIAGSSRREVRLSKWRVLKRTPKGVRIEDYGYNGRGRFVSNTSRKRFALETPELALASYVARKKRQISIYENRLAAAKLFLSMALKVEKRNDDALTELEFLEETHAPLE